MTVNYSAIKRLTDIAVVAGLLMVIWPVLMLIAVAVRVTSPGPALFKQTRVGLHGDPFVLLKFRSMIQAAASGDGSLAATDARITRVGRFLRRWSLDEIPQLLNVLRGEMSLVGPRPTLPDQVLMYDVRECGRLSVRPGITGLAQVSGRNSISWSERIELDLCYVADVSAKLDLGIILRTLPALASLKSLYGPGGHNKPFTGRDDETL